MESKAHWCQIIITWFDWLVGLIIYIYIWICFWQTCFHFRYWCIPNSYTRKKKQWQIVHQTFHKKWMKVRLKRILLMTILKYCIWCPYNLFNKISLVLVILFIDKITWQSVFIRHAFHVKAGLQKGNHILDISMKQVIFPIHVFRNGKRNDSTVTSCLWNTNKILCMDTCLSQQSWLTHWGRDKMADIWQTTFSSAFSWMEMFDFRLKFNEVCS